MTGKREKKTSTKKKKSLRSRTKFPALKPELNLKSRTELIDYDYIDKLSEEEKAWLNKFTEEYVNANLDRKNLENNLHKTRELIKDCDKRNNDWKADILTRSKASGQGLYLEDLKEKNQNIKSYLGEVTDDLEDTGNDSDDNTQST